jgi:hypothetical protein
MSSEQFKFEVFERELIKPLAGLALTEIEAFVAAALFNARSEKPLRIAELIVIVGNRFAEWPTDREIKDLVRVLRKDHAFPILSRRSKPAGFWWCNSEAEMTDFITSFRKQAIDELHTLSRIVRHNYPELAGQLTLEDVTQ